MRAGRYRPRSVQTPHSSAALLASICAVPYRKAKELREKSRAIREESALKRAKNIHYAAQREAETGSENTRECDAAATEALVPGKDSETAARELVDDNPLLPALRESVIHPPRLRIAGRDEQI